MFFALRSHFNPRAVLDNFQDRKGNKVSTVVYLVSLIVRTALLPAYLGLLLWFAGAALSMIAKGSFGVVLEVELPVALAALSAALALPLVLVMFLCMRSGSHALMFAAGLPGLLLVAGLASGSVTDPVKFYGLCLLVHVIALLPFYLLAEEGLSGKRTGYLGALISAPSEHDKIGSGLDIASRDLSQNAGAGHGTGEL